ncbi:uncharacterized protein LOC112203318 [Rosa chinensis]|uniref:uncharacterized protein LOC112203318 n=1 Tax=Rosa chinensis TaxID=74649 RepID=UPI000D08F77F|nr:uncharacterized protein LOC112203318 [Rosa chinensis]
MHEDEEEVPLVEPPAPPVDILHLARLVKEVSKLGAVPFKGSTDHLEAYQWVRNLQNCFRMVVCTSVEKKDVATITLRDEARVWWDFVERSEDVTAMSWEEFERCFKEKYFPRSVVERLEKEFLELTQGNMTVRDYEAEFSRMYHFIRPWDAERLAKHFQRGLNENLRVAVASFELATVA